MPVDLPDRREPEIVDSGVHVRDSERAPATGVQMTLVLAAVFLLAALYFVYRSFYGMRIESEAPADIPAATPERVPAR